MKAVKFYGKNDIRVVDLDVPAVKDHFVKVAPKWCGICGTDLHEFMGGPQMCPTSAHPITGEQVPLVLGHEFSGIIEEVGQGVTDWKVGDRVAVEPIIWDGDCGPCQSGAHNCCDKGGFIGLSGWGGGMSEHVVVPAHSLYRLPDSVSYEVGALIEPLAVGWHAVKVSPHKDGDCCLVLGGGPIGLSVVQALVAQGSKKIIVSEVADKRKDFARQFGATDIIDPTKEDVVKRVKELTSGLGADVIFDCAGVQPALDTAFDALKPRGTLVNVAVWEGSAMIQPTKLLIKEKKYMGIVTYSRGDFEEVLQAITKGKINPEGMITKKITMDEIVEGGFQTLIKEKASQVKILVQGSA